MCKNLKKKIDTVSKYFFSHAKCYLLDIHGHRMPHVLLECHAVQAMMRMVYLHKIIRGLHVLLQPSSNKTKTLIRMIIIIITSILNDCYPIIIQYKLYNKRELL